MTREEKIKIFLERGWSGDVITGIVINSKGKILNRVNSRGYLSIKTTFNKKNIEVQQHQFIWYLAYGETVDEIDHINQIRHDNRIENLRSVTSQQNKFNTKAKGYCFDKRRNKWMAQIMIDGNKIFLGNFDLESDAKQEYLNAKKIYHKI